MFPNRTRATLLPHGVASHSSRAARRSPLSRAHRAIAPRSQPAVCVCFQSVRPCDSLPLLHQTRFSPRVGNGARRARKLRLRTRILVAVVDSPGSSARRQSPTTRWGCSDAKAIPDDSLGLLGREGNSGRLAGGCSGAKAILHPGSTPRSTPAVGLDPLDPPRIHPWQDSSRRPYSY